MCVDQEQLVEYCEYLVEAIKKAEAEKWDLEFTMKENDQKVLCHPPTPPPPPPPPTRIL